MRVLYVGQLGPGMTTRDRMNALARLGHEPIPVNVTDHQASGRLLRSAQWRWQPRALLHGLARAMRATAAAAGRLDVVWIEKGMWVFPEVLEELRHTTGAALVHYSPDAHLTINRSRLLLDALPLYDLVVTTKGFEVAGYQRLGARRVLTVTQGFCPRRFAAPRPDPRFAAPVGLVSDFKPHYGRVVAHLAAHVDGVRVWGRRWEQAAGRDGLPRRVVAGGGVWGDDYVAALASFDLGLGLLSKYIPEQHTTRTFEIPAAGSLLLAERTEEHRALFEEDAEAVLFDSPDELVDKARFYLAHDAARRAIAARGRARCLRSGYDHDAVVATILQAVRG
jgi:hypothetical protein